MFSMPIQRIQCVMLLIIMLYKSLIKSKIMILIDYRMFDGSNYIIGEIIVLDMINRLVAENTIKAPLKGPACFSISKKLLSFQSENHITIKTLTRDAKDIEVPFNQTPLQFSLSQSQPWLMLLTPNNLLEVYLIEYIGGISQGSCKKVAILHNVAAYYENKWGLVLVALDLTLKLISYKEIADSTEVNLNIDANGLRSIIEADPSNLISCHPTSDRLFLKRSSKQGSNNSKQVTDIIDRVNKSPKFEKYASVSYLQRIIAVYRERFVFNQRQEKVIEIVDVQESKLIGRFTLDGVIKFSQIRENLMVITACKDNTDYFHFIVLNPQPTSTQPLITNRGCYEKGRGDFIRFYNVNSQEAGLFLQKKRKQGDISDIEIQKITENTSSILFILNKAKEKIEIVKLEHSKLLKSPFGQQKIDLIIYSKKEGQSQQKKEQAVEIERARIHSSVELKVSGQSMEEMQKKFVENLIEIKLKNVFKQFQRLQKRVADLQILINGINSKIQQNLEKINRKEIKQKVQQLFNALTPQFQKYFSEIFKQVSGVCQQGVSYYNLKLAKQAEFHKQALTQVVTDTFKFTQEVAQISRKEQSVSDKTEDYLKKILESKRKWVRTTEEFESRTKEVPSPVVKLGLETTKMSPDNPKGGSQTPKTEGKVFVRADLNFIGGKKQI